MIMYKEREVIIMKYTARMSSNGELAMRRASAKAQKFYGETTPLEVWEYEADKYRIVDSRVGSIEREYGVMTFDEIKNYFGEGFENCTDIYDITDILSKNNESYYSVEEVLMYAYGENAESDGIVSDLTFEELQESFEYLQNQIDESDD